MEQISILVNGSKGKMGQEAVKAISSSPHLTLCAEADRGDDLMKMLQTHSPQVVVDFTTASAAFENAQTIVEFGSCPVIGTSGLQTREVEELQQKCKSKNLGGLIAPNFAIGAVLMMKFAQEASKFFPDAEIIEMHHNKKADAPSGTAIKTVNMIASARKHSPAALDEKELIPGARGAKNHDVHVHSVRLPGLIAHQSVLFGGEGELLSIRHDSFDRKSFMPGVCLACEKVTGLNELIYGLENLIS